ncbi:MAG TPA: hypothetical protein VKB51_08555 [bacterium]|nr:hypothetical protein [bacterium]
MKPLRAFPEILLAPFKALRPGEPTANAGANASRGKGQSLLRLHEYQHRVIVEIFKVSLAGFLTFTLVLLGFALYSLLDPYSPRWMALVIGTMAVVLLVALYRTLQEFKAYHRNYDDITAQLRAKLLQQTRSAAGAAGAVGKAPVEHRLLSALRPKEHTGWDFKPCTNCQKSIELLATVCQHCGHEQETVLVN